ncbi:hypothetical protein C8R45DRAFT_1218738 [Mycena sanguinolenta]|nr:hypothetical protein C8R45DRAFT_1218738 [Mycena sanguinolenta]
MTQDESNSVAVASGINRFPTELLVEIFALCWHSSMPRFTDAGTPSYIDRGNPGELTLTIPGAPPPDMSASFKTEIARLAHAPLLAVGDGHALLVVRNRAQRRTLGHPESQCHRPGAARVGPGPRRKLIAVCHARDHHGRAHIPCSRL